MPQLHGFEHFEVQFDTVGGLVDGAQKTALIDFIGNAANGITDVIVISHGWNNNMAEARELYSKFFANLRKQLDAGQVIAPNARKFAIVGVLWPSKKFESADLIPGGAASLGMVGAGGAAGVGGAAPGPSDAVLSQQLDELKAFLDSPTATANLDEAKALVPKLQNSPANQAKFADLVRGSLTQNAKDSEDASDKFFTVSADSLMTELSKPIFTMPQPGAGGGAAGGAAGGAGGPPGGPPGGAAGFIGNFFGGVKNGAKNLINYSTYYAMKNRAGVVGSQGLNGVLRELLGKRPDVKLHLVGHSFGGRLVTATVHGAPGQPPLKVNSMALLQAAFSHNGFATKFDTKNDGFFRGVVTDKKVTGPIIVTHTKNDSAVGMAYPLASRIALQKASALGDENDVYGGIGRNGALTKFTPEAVNVNLQGDGKAYTFAADKRIHNLLADAFITGHGDVTRPEVTHAVLSAIATT